MVEKTEEFENLKKDLEKVIEENEILKQKLNALIKTEEIMNFIAMKGRKNSVKENEKCLKILKNLKEQITFTDFTKMEYKVSLNKKKSIFDEMSKRLEIINSNNELICRDIDTINISENDTLKSLKNQYSMISRAHNQVFFFIRL